MYMLGPELLLELFPTLHATAQVLLSDHTSCTPEN